MVREEGEVVSGSRNVVANEQCEPDGWSAQLSGDSARWHSKVQDLGETR
jgi:hypothetical protein